MKCFKNKVCVDFVDYNKRLLKLDNDVKKCGECMNCYEK